MDVCGCVVGAGMLPLKLEGTEARSTRVREGGMAALPSAPSGAEPSASERGNAEEVGGGLGIALLRNLSFALLPGIFQLFLRLSWRPGPDWRGAQPVLLRRSSACV